MKKTVAYKMIALLLCLALLLPTFASCSFGFGNGDGDYESDDDTEPEDKNDPEPEPFNPYFEHYVADELFDEHYLGKWAYLQRYKYVDEDSYPMYMGGYPYYGGFTVSAHGYSEQAYIAFDVSEYSGKTLSFAMGSAQTNGYQDTAVAVMQVRLDGKTVIEKKISAPDPAEWYTLDLTGASELSFQITQDNGGQNLIGIAEMTIWDSREDVLPTAHVQSTGGVRAQLVKDIYPHLFKAGGGGNATLIYTQTTPPGFMTDFAIAQATTKAPASVGGKTYIEAFGIREAEPLMGESKSSVYFYTEEQYGYLSFMVGGEDVENARAGVTWLTVYADDKIVHEELVTSNELPKRYSVSINNCKVLRFEVQYESGSASRPVVFDAFVGKTASDAVGTLELNPTEYADICKLVSTINPYAMSVADENPLFDGSSAYHTFTMAGRKYNEGIVLFPVSTILNGSKNSYACFNLEGQFKYLTFKAGLLDKSPCIIDDTLNVYLDGVLSESISLVAMDLPTDYQIDLKNCRELRLELTGKENYNRPAYGLSEMVVYKNEITENDLFPAEEMNYPDEMRLIQNSPPYMIYNSSAQEMGEQIVFDGSTKKEYFEIGGEKINEGVILKTAVHIDWTGSGGGASGTSMMAAVMAANIVGGALALLAGGVLYENSFAGFDLRGEFSKVTFTVACSDPDYYLTGMEETTELLVGSNEELMATFTVSRDMEPTTYTVDIKNTEQLIFFLKCGDGASAPYAIYDIIVTK